MAGSARHERHELPGTVRPRSFVPRLHYELLVCGLRGHALIGTDAAELRDEDGIFARDLDGVRWYRCLRCDSWLPVGEPQSSTRSHPPRRDEIALPLRGKALRDKIVLRAIAVDRAFHFVLLALLAVAIFLFTAHQHQLRDTFYRVVADIQNTAGGAPVQHGHVGILGELDKLFSLRAGTLHLVGLAVSVYAVLEGVEAIGLWYQQRWAEYLTFIATTALLPLEVYELTRTISPLKIVALIVNFAVVIYLLRAKRLFGFNGGAAAERAERARDVGWEALERTAPERDGLAPASGGLSAR
jgi:uncharacterized membrane protein (DUF2068 family)